VPRGIPRVAAYIALGAALTFVVIFLAVTTAHARYPWTEADGKDVVFFGHAAAPQRVAKNLRRSMWLAMWSSVKKPI
jgi:hypothetical protein